MKNILLLFVSFISMSTFAQVVEKAPMPGERTGHTCTSLYNDENNAAEFLVLGGFDGSDYLDSTYVFNYETNLWTAGESMNFLRYDHVALQLQDGRVLVTGGWNGVDANQNTTEYYDPEFGFWEEGPLMSVGRSTHTMTLMDDGRVLICGGYDGFENTSSVEIFDPSDNSITPVTPMNYGRSAHTATNLGNGKFIVTGGFNPNYGFQMNQCEIYDLISDSWTEVGAMSSGRDNHAAIITTNGLMVSGGRFYNASLNLFEGQSSTELFDLDLETWSPGSDLPSGQSYHQMWQLANKIVLVGGADHTGLEVTITYSNSAEYNEEMNEWSDSNWSDADGKFLYASDMELIYLGYQTTIFVCGGEGDPSSEVYMDSNSIIEYHQQLGQAYPNPATDFVTLETTESLNSYSIEVFDVQGREVLDWTMKSDNSMTVSQLSAGIYYITLTQGAEKLVFKMVKE